MCIGIIRNNSLVDRRDWAESNPGHWARHALLHMAAECVNHSATKAGPLHRLRYIIITKWTQQYTHDTDSCVWHKDSIGLILNNSKRTVLNNTKTQSHIAHFTVNATACCTLPAWDHSEAGQTSLLYEAWWTDPHGWKYAHLVLTCRVCRAENTLK